MWPSRADRKQHIGMRGAPGGAPRFLGACACVELVLELYNNVKT